MVQQQVVEKLLKYRHLLRTQQQAQGGPTFTANEQANKLIKENPAAYLFAVIMDEGTRAEYIYEIPYQLKRLLGHLDISKIATMTEEALDQTFKNLPRKPRYRAKAARRIKRACQMILERYQGQPERIWGDNPKAGDLEARLAKFDGIGQKKASMATRTLAEDLKVPVQAWDEIDVSYDALVPRVFLRAGLCAENSQRAIIDAARRLNPDYPGALDIPCWMIGRKWCRPKKPDCANCYISNVCPRKGVP